MIDLYPVIEQCAPGVATKTVAAIIKTESGGKPFSIGINGRKFKLQRQPRTLQEAQGWAQWLMDNGLNFDAGLMQINIVNWKRLGLSPGNIFDACTNIAAGARVLTENYNRAASSVGPGQYALLKALSAYNTGNFKGGFSNGYVAKVQTNAGRVPSVAPPMSGWAYRPPAADPMFAAPAEAMAMRPLRTPPGGVNPGMDNAPPMMTATRQPLEQAPRPQEIDPSSADTAVSWNNGGSWGAGPVRVEARQVEQMEMRRRPAESRSSRPQEREMEDYAAADPQTSGSEEASAAWVEDWNKPNAWNPSPLKKKRPSREGEEAPTEEAVYADRRQTASPDAMDKPW